MRALVELIDRYQPGFAATVAGADEETIEDLADLMGALPGAYLRFLRTMGASLAEFTALGPCFDLEACRSMVLIKPWIKHERYLYIAYDSDDSGWDYYMDRATPTGDDDCLVVRMPLSWREDTSARMPSATGLEELLHLRAYRHIRIPLLAHRSTLMQPITMDAARRCTSAVVHARIEALGFERVPPASPSALYERGDAAALVYQVPYDPGFSVLFGCGEPRELHRIDAELRSTGLVTPPITH